MKREAIITLFLSMAITILTALAYFSKRNQFIMNKFVIVIIKSFHFNSTPILSISFLAIGEYLLWETQNNSDVMAVKDKITERMNLIVYTAQLHLMSLSKRNLIAITEFRDNIQSVHVRELRFK
jgi:hypothetical protein